MTPRPAGFPRSIWFHLSREARRAHKRNYRLDREGRIRVWMHWLGKMEDELLRRCEPMYGFEPKP